MANSSALIGIAGVHYVVAELSRRGMVALPTTRNTAAYDIVVVTPDGDKHANIQVKASSKRVTFFRCHVPIRFARVIETSMFWYVGLMTQNSLRASC